MTGQSGVPDTTAANIANGLPRTYADDFFPMGRVVKKRKAPAPPADTTSPQ